MIKQQLKKILLYKFPKNTPIDHWSIFMRIISPLIILLFTSKRQIKVKSRILCKMLYNIFNLFITMASEIFFLSAGTSSASAFAVDSGCSDLQIMLFPQECQIFHSPCLFSSID